MPQLRTFCEEFLWENYVTVIVLMWNGATRSPFKKISGSPFFTQLYHCIHVRKLFAFLLNSCIVVELQIFRL